MDKEFLIWLVTFLIALGISTHFQSMIPLFIWGGALTIRVGAPILIHISFLD